MEEKGLGDSNDTNVFASHISPQMHEKISKLFGKKCIVNCFINGTKLEASWNAGSQVSLLPVAVVERCFPQVAVREISEILDAECANFNLVTANSTKLPYI